MKTKPLLSAPLVFLVAILSGAVFAVAQQAMTNQDVLDLIKANISTDVVVTSIENAKSVEFDVQPKAIILLKKEGAEDRVIQALLRKSGSMQATATLPVSEPAKPSSYEDGYQLGIRYGTQFRNSGQRYVPGETIILPGSLVMEMTVKLGAVEYEKWEDGYRHGFEDGRKGVRRQPTNAGRGRGDEKLTSNVPGAYPVSHHHGGGGLRGSQGSCEGTLQILSDRLVYSGSGPSDGDGHSLDISFAELQEVSINVWPIAKAEAFHVRLRDGTNHNFTAPGSSVSAIVKAIGAAARTPPSGP